MGIYVHSQIAATTRAKEKVPVFPLTLGG